MVPVDKKALHKINGCFLRFLYGEHPVKSMFSAGEYLAIYAAVEIVQHSQISRVRRIANMKEEKCSSTLFSPVLPAHEIGIRIIANAFHNPLRLEPIDIPA